MAYRRYSETSETNALLDFRSQVQGRGCVGVFEVAEVVQTPTSSPAKLGVPENQLLPG